jgi:hypothetical protein
MDERAAVLMPVHLIPHTFVLSLQILLQNNGRTVREAKAVLEL